MTQTYYDPDVEPDPREWPALPDHDRVRIVQNYQTCSLGENND